MNDSQRFYSNSDISLFAYDTLVYELNKIFESEIMKDIQAVMVLFFKTS